MRHRPPTRVSVALAALALGLQPSLGWSAPTVTIVQGGARVVSAGRPYRAAPGLRLQGCDVVQTGRPALVQVEFDDGSAVALGQASAFVVEVPDTPAADVHVLASGWAKLTVPQGSKPAPHHLSTPHFGVRLDQGVAVVHVGDKASELFVEGGAVTVLAPGQRPQVLAAGRFHAAAPGAGSAAGGASRQSFIDAMPREFRDTLPMLAATFKDRTVTPAPAGAESSDATWPGVPALKACQSDVSVRNAQEALQRLGIAVGPIDGIHGRLTRAALREFQTRRGLPATGLLDAGTQSALAEADRRR